MIWRARPMGQAFIAALLGGAISSTIALFMTPSVLTLKLTVQEIPEVYEQAEFGPIVDGRALGSEFPGCHWRLPADLARNGLSGPPAPRRVFCEESVAAEKIDHEFPLKELRKRFEADPDWHVADHSTLYEAFGRSNAISMAGYLLLPVLVTLVLLRRLPIREDLARAGRAIVRQPWVVAVVPLTMGGGSVLFNAIFPIRVDRLPEAAELFQAVPMGALAIVLVMPIFEEAIFRQWLYVRTIDRLPVWVVAVGSAWFFMLIHIFNPQVIAIPGYLPTVFVGGLAFFWIRHRFGSFSLAALAHVLNNGLFFYLAKAFPG